MAFTVEEKIEKLKAANGWGQFTDNQRAFLTYMAESDFNLRDSYIKAYPNGPDSAVTFNAHNAIRSLSIRAALANIGYEREKSEVVSKKEALELMSRHMRRPIIEPETLVKLMGVYSKIAGWDKETDAPSEEVSMDKLVEAIEKKRKNREKTL